MKMKVYLNKLFYKNFVSGRGRNKASKLVELYNN